MEELRRIDQEKIESPSLYVFKYDSSIRKTLIMTVESSYFENVMLIFILISCLQLAIDSPLNDP
jgi:hypothetical protein